MRDSSDPKYKQLSNITISLDDGRKTDVLIEGKVIKDGTHAFASANQDILNWYTYLEDNYKTHWYRGTETILSEYPYNNWLSKKKWPLNEELNLHIMQYQEVNTKISNTNLVLTLHS